MRRRGFTLLELIASTAVMSAAIVLMLGLLMEGTTLFRLESTEADLNAECRRVLDAVARDLARSSASRLTPPLPLNAPALTIQRAIAYDPAAHRIVYLPTSVLYRVESYGGERVIVRYENAADPATRSRLTADVAPVGGLRFTLDAAGRAVTVTVTLQRINARGRLIVHSRTEAIQLRN